MKSPCFYNHSMVCETCQSSKLQKQLKVHLKAVQQTNLTLWYGKGISWPSVYTEGWIFSKNRWLLRFCTFTITSLAHSLRNYLKAVFCKNNLSTTRTPENSAWKDLPLGPLSPPTLPHTHTHSQGVEEVLLLKWALPVFSYVDKKDSSYFFKLLFLSGLSKIWRRHTPERWNIAKYFSKHLWFL